MSNLEMCSVVKMSDLVSSLRHHGAVKSALNGRGWEIMAGMVDEWLTSDEIRSYVERYTEARPPKEDDDYHKYYVARALPYDLNATVTLGADDPFLKTALSLAGLAQEYFDGHQPRLEYYDIWHTFPLESTRERRGSQQWHRDQAAFGKPNRLFKSFLYFSDCLDDGAGPLQIQGPQGLVTCFAHRGDIWFADTGAYLHQGGYSTTQSRTYAVWVFYDAHQIRSKPRYNLTPEARAHFDSPILWTRDQWDEDRYS